MAVEGALAVVVVDLKFVVLTVVVVWTVVVAIAIRVAIVLYCQ